MTVKIITRSFRVEIETPSEDADKMVKYHRRSDLYDGETLLGVAGEQPQPIAFRMVDEAATMRTAIDPVTQQSVTVSIAGLAALIKADYDARNTQP